MGDENMISIDGYAEEVMAEQKYPGVRYSESLDKWIATFKKEGMVMVATRDTFEEAKQDMIFFERS